MLQHRERERDRFADVTLLRYALPPEPANRVVAAAFHGLETIVAGAAAVPPSGGTSSKHGMAAIAGHGECGQSVQLLHRLGLWLLQSPILISAEELLGTHQTKVSANPRR